MKTPEELVQTIHNLCAEGDCKITSYAFTVQKPSGESQIIQWKCPSTSAGAPYKRPPAMVDDLFIEECKQNRLYTGLDIDLQHRLATEWCTVNSRQLTRRFFINWLGKRVVRNASAAFLNQEYRKF